jgi:hypothetical protein
MGILATPNPKTEGHIMCNAGAPDTYFAMLVYKNADLVRRAVRDACCRKDWAEFARQVCQKSPTIEVKEI